MRNDHQNTTRVSVEWIARMMVWAAGAALIIMSFVITAEALLRKFAGISLGGVNEFSAYLFAVTSAWAFGWALISGAHIRISLLRAYLGRRASLALDALALCVFVVVFAVIAYRGADLAWESYSTGARAPSATRILLFIPQSLWAFGLVMTAVSGLWLGYRVIRDRDPQLIAPVDEAEFDLEGSN